jgi:hypothetical protein
MSAQFGIYLAGIVTIALYSYLIGDNKMFKFAEHLYVGSAAGHAITMGYINIRDLGWTPLVTKGQVMLLIPILLGLCLYSRFTTKFVWVSRYAIAVTIGIGTGVTLRGMPSAQILSQLQASMVIKNVNDFLAIVGMVGVMLYFLFIYAQNPVTKGFARIGRLVMMITFGVGFGTSTFSMVARGTGAVTAILRMLGLVK